jgi:glycosyltransferase involved in cell wall biosynthesis
VARILFTVILPVYRVEEYLPQCLDSLAAQCGDDVQILLIDDGSPDGSLAFLRQYEQKYPNMQVYTHANAGVAYTRNVGLANARGEYLLWVDPDDWVAPGWLEAIRRGIADRPDLLLYDYFTVDNGRERAFCYGRPAGSVAPEQVLRDLSEDTRLTSVLWNKALRRELFEGLTFDESLKCMEDAELLCRLLPRVKTVRYLPEALYYYRIRPDGLVLTPDLSTALRCWQLALKREEHIRALGIPASSVGGWRQAKGFLCKYYRAGMPKEQQPAYRQVRSWLNQSLAGCLRDRSLPLSEKLKYLLIGSPPVGRCYAIYKKLRMKNGG